MRHTSTARRAVFCQLLPVFSLFAAATAQAQVVSVLPGTTGEQKIAVVLVNSPEAPGEPMTRVAAHDLVFGKISDFFWESSYQRTFLSGQTFGWFTLPSGLGCNSSLIAQEANRAVTAAGASIDAYDQVVYMWPTNSACNLSGWTGKAPNGQKQLFVNGGSAMNLRVIAHEMGHNFGLMHSDALDCDVSALGNSCVKRDGYDAADLMGSRGVHLSAFQKERLGWLNAAGAPPIADVVASGRYSIAPMAAAGGLPRALRILKSTDPATGQKTWYYVEYRQPVGFDAPLATVGNLTSGVLVHVASDFQGWSSTTLLDMTPGSSTVASLDFQDAALAVGRTFSDAASGVTISLVAADASGVAIDVGVPTGGSPTPSCTRAAPAITLAGPAAAVAAGTTVGYTVTLLNQDSSACPSTSFSLAETVPTGWSSAMGTRSISISAGSSASTTLSITSPAGATAAGYGIGVGAGSAVGSAHTSSAATTYTVAAASFALSNSVGTDKVSYLRGETVNASARVMSNGVPVAGAEVRFTLAKPDGSNAGFTVSSGSDGYARMTFKPGKSKSAIGNYTLKADASRNGASASATSAFSVR